MRKYVLFSKELLILILCPSILCQLNAPQNQSLRRSQSAVIITPQTFENQLLTLIQNTPYAILLDALESDKHFGENIWFQAYLEKLTSDSVKRHQKLIYAERLCSIFNLGQEAESKLILAIQFEQAKSEWEERNGSALETPETENPARSQQLKETFIYKHGETLWNVLDRAEGISEKMKDRIALILLLSNGTWGEHNKQETRKRMVKTLIALGKDVENPKSPPGAYKLMKLIEYFAGTKGIDMSVLWMNEDLKKSRYDNISVLYFARQLEEEGYQEIGIDGSITRHTDVKVAAINLIVYFDNRQGSAEADIILSIDRHGSVIDLTWTEIKNRHDLFVPELGRMVSSYEAKELLSPEDYRLYLNALEQSFLGDYRMQLLNYRKLVQSTGRLILKEGTIVDIDNRMIIQPNGKNISLNSVTNVLLAIGFADGLPFRTERDLNDLTNRLQMLFSGLPEAKFFDIIMFTFFDIDPDIKHFIDTCQGFK